MQNSKIRKKGTILPMRKSSLFYETRERWNPLGVRGTGLLPPGGRLKARRSVLQGRAPHPSPSASLTPALLAASSCMRDSSPCRTTPSQVGNHPNWEPPPHSAPQLVMLPLHATSEEGQQLAELRSAVHDPP